MPTSGPAVVANAEATFEGSLPLLAVVDRRMLVATVSKGSPPALERYAAQTSLVVLRDGDPGWIKQTAKRLADALHRNQVVALPTERAGVDLLWAEVFAAAPVGVPIVPAVVVEATGRRDRSETWVYFGEPIPVGDLETAAAAR